MTRLCDKTNLNAMIKAIKLAANEQNFTLNIKQNDDTVSIKTLGGKDVFKAIKTNGPWLATFDADLFA